MYTASTVKYQYLQNNTAFFSQDQTKKKSVTSSLYIAFWQPNLHVAFFPFLMCILKKSLKWNLRKTTNTRKNKLQNDFTTWDISYVYVVNQIFESVSDLSGKQMSKMIGSTYDSALVCNSFMFCW